MEVAVSAGSFAEAHDFWTANRARSAPIEDSIQACAAGSACLTHRPAAPALGDRQLARSCAAFGQNTANCAFEHGCRWTHIEPRTRIKHRSQFANHQQNGTMRL
jgi:hypothetical protein